MKSIKELRHVDFRIENQSTRVDYLKSRKIDFNVFLPSRGINLQRDLVWDVVQKRELIWSILYERKIPHIAILSIVDKQKPAEDILQIIDGKQRLTSIFSFIDNEYTLLIDGTEYYFNELPNDYQIAILKCTLDIKIVLEPWDNPFTDEQKIKWFSLINFAGTPMDKEHINKLNS